MTDSKEYDEFKDSSFEETDEVSEETDNDVLNSIELPAKRNLSNSGISDSCLVSELPKDAKPLKPLPVDEKADMLYETIIETKCVLCKSPHRTLAEHVYLANGNKPYAVQLFFLEYFNARISWDCVDIHMRRHCRFDKLRTSGLDYIVHRGPELALWEYREARLAIQTLLCQIDEVQGLNCQNDVSNKLKQAEMVRKLSRDLEAMARKRDESASKFINIQDILMEIWQAMPTAETKAIIINKIQDIQRELNG